MVRLIRPPRGGQWTSRQFSGQQSAQVDEQRVHVGELLALAVL